MTLDDLVHALRELAKAEDNQREAHMDADDLLLAYIGSDAVSAAFRSIPKWYA
jgi:hypothetical protein